ncbi:hypothetical protein [Hanstruepera ponticola]|uniref:hypothetical protein n=1 Tax=Hanstruepera ponticola TaxID=2042995 RepID=UPI000CF045C0|nr:hypothetical protein [Hanstruepera ponticola]
MNNYKNHRTNYFFPSAARILGFVMIIIGLIGIFSRGIETILISFIGFGICFTRYGVLIDTTNHKLKDYNQVFGIKFGKWELFKNYPYITVLTITEKSTTYSQSNLENSTRRTVYRITLLNENHYKKLLLKKLKNEKEANKLAEDYAKLYKLEKVVYSPG